MRSTPAEPQRYLRERYLPLTYATNALFSDLFFLRGNGAPGRVAAIPVAEPLTGTFYSPERYKKGVRRHAFRHCPSGRKTPNSSLRSSGRRASYPPCWADSMYTSRIYLPHGRFTLDIYGIMEWYDSRVRQYSCYLLSDNNSYWFSS